MFISGGGSSGIPPFLQWRVNTKRPSAFRFPFHFSTEFRGDHPSHLDGYNI